MSLVSAQSSSHWYHRDGTSCHQVPMASKPGQMRNTTLADARKLSLLPSITNYLGILDKPMLSAWRVEQGILAALTLPRLEHELDDEFAKRVVTDSESQVTQAANRGTAIHNILENYLLGLPIDPNQEFLHLVIPTIEWLSQNVKLCHYTEKTVVHPRFAGRLDMKADIAGIGLAVIDFKTRKKGKDGKFAVYPENGLQLSAYLEADKLGTDAAYHATDRISIIIGSEEAEAPHIHVWDRSEHDATYNAFLSITEVWSFLKKYRP
jgi:hypothetical protein